MYKKVFETKEGYYKIKELPSEKELRNYYQETYFQKGKSTYKKTYNRNEEKYLFNRFVQKKYILEKKMKYSLKGKSFLDIGCGEGFSLDFFEKQGMVVTGIDYSNEGILLHNKKYAKKVIVGDITETIKKMLKNNEKYDLILLDNVLEHVLKPKKTLEMIRLLLDKKGVLIIEVPNDFSTLQLKLMNEKKVSRPYWINIPDHINYFNPKSLKKICGKSGFKERYTLTDYPIDLNLLFSETNYVDKPYLGEKCHNRRIEIENYISDLSIKSIIKIQREFAKIGLGRNILTFMEREK